MTLLRSTSSQLVISMLPVVLENPRQYHAACFAVPDAKRAELVPNTMTSPDAIISSKREVLDGEKRTQSGVIALPILFGLE